MLNCVEKGKVVVRLWRTGKERRTYHRWLSTTKPIVRQRRTSLLGIEGYVVEGVREEGDRWVVEVAGQIGEVSCPRCSCCRLYRHGKARARSVLHGWSRGRRIYLLMSRQAEESALGGFWSLRSTVYAR